MWAHRLHADGCATSVGPLPGLRMHAHGAEGMQQEAVLGLYMMRRAGHAALPSFVDWEFKNTGMSTAGLGLAPSAYRKAKDREVCALLGLATSTARRLAQTPR